MAGDSRLGRWARRRARQFCWAASILAVAMALTAVGVMLWRASYLFGLPDIGDPFDVAAFRVSNTVPEDQDAVVLFRQAAAVLRPMPEVPQAARLLVGAAWSKVDPKLRDWLEENRAALALFRQGAERPDGSVNPGVELGSRIGGVNPGSFVLLAVLEGSRLEEKGDMEGAWSWYRTVLRMRTLVMRRGSVRQRFYLGRQCEKVNARIESWATDPKTDALLLRRALADALLDEPKPEWDAHSLKFDYMIMLGVVDDPNSWLEHGSDQELDFRIFDEKLPPNILSQLHALRRFVLNEPELSRRVVRLAFANWLTHAQHADPGRHKPTVLAWFALDKRGTTIPFFNVGPEAPESARRLSPDELARRLLTTRDARWLFNQFPWPTTRISEKRTHARLVLLLASELYRREHGKPPSSDQALVGPCLDHLPDDGSDELDDGLTRRVPQSPGPRSGASQ
jgi:hypothetical protein